MGAHFFVPNFTSKEGNKINKRILTCVLAAIMAVSLTACSDSKESSGNGTPVYTDDPSIVYSPADDFEYWYDEAAGGTMIRGYIDAGGEIAIPKEIEGKPVTIIDRNTFKDNAAITSIYIPSTVKKIDQCAFQNCKSLEAETLKNGLESIGWSAFNGYEKIKSIEIPDTVTTLEGKTDSSFSDSPGLGIFGYCTSLETAVIGKGIYTIPSYCFMNCTSLKSITIPGNVRMLGNEAFYNCTNLETVILEEGVEQIGNPMYISSGTYVFSNCTSLVNLTLPETLERITFYAFDSCNSLTDVEVPANCKIIGNAVFNDCPDIKAKFRGKTYTYDQLNDLQN